jgi:hypothetical protein
MREFNPAQEQLYSEIRQMDSSSARSLGLAIKNLCLQCVGYCVLRAWFVPATLMQLTSQISITRTLQLEDKLELAVFILPSGAEVVIDKF